MRWLAFAMVVIFNTGAHLLLKSAMSLPQKGDSLLAKISVFVQPLWISGIFCFVLSLVFYSYTLTKFELSVAQPAMTCISLVLVFIFSILFFKESYHWSKIVGTIVIICGVILLTSRG